MIDHRKSGLTVDEVDVHVVTRRGQRKLRQTTIGWELQVQWQDLTKQWVPLNILEESNPVAFAIYIKAKGIHKEPASIKQKLKDSITLEPYKENGLVMEKGDQDDPHTMNRDPSTFTLYAEEKGN